MDSLATIIGSNVPNYVYSGAIRAIHALAYASVFDSNVPHTTSSASNWFSNQPQNKDVSVYAVAFVLVCSLVLLCLAITTCACVCGILCALLGCAGNRLIFGFMSQIGQAGNIGRNMVGQHMRNGQMEVRRNEDQFDIEALSSVAEFISIGGTNAVDQIAREAGVNKESVVEWWLAWKKARRGPRRLHDA